MNLRNLVEKKIDKNAELFCFFTGLTRGMLTIVDIQRNEKSKTCVFTLSVADESKLEDSPYIQLDGVLCQVTDRKKNSITVSTTYELLQNTTLNNISKNDKVSVGILAKYDSEDYQSFLNHPSANSVAKVEGVSIKPGHQHTLKIDFSYQSNAVTLEENKHIGLAGSSVLVRELKNINGLQLFSIYSGRQSREGTIFNASIKTGQLVNVTASKLDKPIEQPYPIEYQRPSNT